MLHVYVYTCTHAYVEFHVMCVHARMRRLVWSGDGTYTYVGATMAGARKIMRVRIPSSYVLHSLLSDTIIPHIHAPFIMYCSRLFVVVFQEINCLHTFKHTYVRRVTELHLSTKFHVCQCCG